MCFKVDVINSQAMLSFLKMERESITSTLLCYACNKFQEMLCSWNKIIPYSWSLLLFAYDLDERPCFLIELCICFLGPIKFICGTPKEVKTMVIWP